MKVCLKGQRRVGRREKLNVRLICPACRFRGLQFDKSEIVCANCGEKYPTFNGSPFLLKSTSPYREAFIKVIDLSNNPTVKARVKARIRQVIKVPEARLWSRKSKRVITDLLIMIDPDDQDHFVMNVGAGFEKIFHQAFLNYSDVFRIGLPHTGKVDVYGDAMDFPISDSSVDLLFSSSVIEHLENPEVAVHEIHRVLKPGGFVYAEIPFLRAYHMAPIDYQRYTIAGIESLFGRHGFQLICKGICSGPFTGFALFVRDFLVSMCPGRVAKVLTTWNRNRFGKVTSAHSPLKCRENGLKVAKMACYGQLKRLNRKLLFLRHLPRN